VIGHNENEQLGEKSSQVWAAANHDCELQFVAKMKSLSFEPS